MYYNQLQNLSSTSSRNEKIQLLIEYLKDPIFYSIFAISLNPLNTFGVKTIQFNVDSQDDKTLSWAIDQLKNLINQNHSNQLIDNIKNILSNLNERNQVIIKNMILKDLKCGVQIALFNKAVQQYNLANNFHYQKIFDYPCMLASAFSEKLINKLDFKQGVFCQLKADGMRFNAVIRNGHVDFFGRSGKKIYIENQQLIDEFLKFGNDVVVDGQLLIKIDDTIIDRKTGNGILNKAVRGTISTKQQHYIIADIWDLIPLSDFLEGVCDIPYKQRFESLKQKCDSLSFEKINLIETIFVHSKQQCYDMFESVTALGQQGVIIKSPNNIWKNVRSSDLIKIKEQKQCELKVIGYNQISNGKNMVGSLFAISQDGLLQVGVGSGLTQQDRINFYNDDIVGKIITVKYNMCIVDKNTNKHSLFLPRFQQIRLDKTTADNLETILSL